MDSYTHSREPQTKIGLGNKMTPVFFLISGAINVTEGLMATWTRNVLSRRKLDPINNPPRALRTPCYRYAKLNRGEKCVMLTESKRECLFALLFKRVMWHYTILKSLRRDLISQVVPVGFLARRTFSCAPCSDWLTQATPTDSLWLPLKQPRQGLNWTLHSHYTERGKWHE